jgi:hypothetical protein
MPNFGDRGAPASASAAITAASSAKLSDNSSQVNWRPTSKIVTALIHGARNKIAAIFTCRAGGDDGGARYCHRGRLW